MMPSMFTISQLQACVPPTSVKDARDRAVKDYIRDHPDVDPKQIQVGLSVQRRTKAMVEKR
jgi:hypothetical protein